MKINICFYASLALNLANVGIIIVVVLNLLQTCTLFDGRPGQLVTAVAIKCPPDRVLYPCKCHHNERILCSVPMTYSLSHIFKAISQSKPSQQHQYHHYAFPIGPLFKEFVLSNEYLDELGDNVFHSVRFEKISLNNMKSLARIKANAFNGTIEDVQSFAIKGTNKLGIKYINQLFDALSSLKNVREMHLELDNLRMIPSYAFRDVLMATEPIDSDKNSSRNIRLERLRIISRSLLQISSYAFYELYSLRYIKILSFGGLQRISAHAFDIAQPSSHPLVVDLRLNQLTVGSFEQDSFHKVNRPVHLQLTHNNLTTINREIFERFLNTDQQNTLELMDNPLECDCTMFWILKDRSIFINQIHNAVCVEYADLWALDENAFRKCAQDMDYMPRLIFRNSAILSLVKHLVFLPLLVQIIL